MDVVNYKPLKKKSFLQRASMAGQDPKAFAKANIHTNSEVGKMARLAYTIQGVHGSGKAQMNKPGDSRTAGQILYQIG